MPLNPTRTGPAIRQHLQPLYQGPSEDTFAAHHALDWMKWPLDSHTSHDPHTWNVQQTAQWITSIGLAEYAPAFEEHCVDGCVLFYITEEDFEHKMGITKLGLRKKLLLARIWLLNEYRKSQAILASAHAKKKRALGKLTAVSALSPRSRPISLFDDGEDDDWKNDQMLVEGNLPKWQGKFFKKLRNISGGMVLVLELLMSLIRLNPLLHLISLLPLLFGMSTGAAEACKL